MIIEITSDEKDTRDHLFSIIAGYCDPGTLDRDDIQKITDDILKRYVLTPRQSFVKKALAALLNRK